MPGNSELGWTGPATALSSASVTQKGVLYREGEYWTIGLGGNTVRLKDSKGFAYLSYLVRHPATEFHVLDLLGGITNAGDGDKVDRQFAASMRGDYELEKAGKHIGGLGDAGKLLDDKAKSAYRGRISELREQLEEAKALRKAESAEKLEAEIQALPRELSRAVGLAFSSARGSEQRPRVSACHSRS